MKYAITIVVFLCGLLSNLRAQGVGDRDISVIQYIWEGGVFDHTQAIFSQPPSGANGLYFWNDSNATNRKLQFIFLGTTINFDSGTNTLNVTPATTSTPGSLSASDKTKLDALSIPEALSFNNAASHAVVTTTASTGFQVSASRHSHVSYSGSLSTTSTIGGAATANAYLEICATNSTTPGDWITVQAALSSQTITLAIALQSIQSVPATLSAIVPAGYYTRIRSSGTGTFSVSTFTGQEVLN